MRILLNLYRKGLRALAAAAVLAIAPALLLSPILADDAAAKSKIVLLYRGNNVEQEGYKALIGEFQKQNPDIEVELVWSAGAAGEIYEKLLTMVAGGQAPDVFWVHSFHIADLAAKGLLLPLDGFVQKEKSFPRSDFMGRSLEIFSYAENLVGLPKESGTQVLYYNTEAFQSAGVAEPNLNWHWNDMMQAARKLTRNVGGVQSWGLWLPSVHQAMLGTVWQNGGEVTDAKRTRFTFDIPATSAALQWIADLRNKERIAALSSDFAGTNLLTAFERARVAMLYGNRAFGQSLPQNFAWDVALIPANKERVYPAASAGHAVFSKSKQPEAAWKLVRFLSSERAQQEYVAPGTVVPASRKVALSKAFLNPSRLPERDDVFIRALEFARPEPVTPNYFAVISLETRILAPVWTGEKPVQQAIVELNQQLTQLIK